MFPERYRRASNKSTGTSIPNSFASKPEIGLVPRTSRRDLALQARRVIAVLMNFADILREALFSPQCCICQSRENAFCVDCAPFVHERHDEYLADAQLPLRCLGVYKGNLRRAVLELKEGRRDVGQMLALHLAERVSDLDWMRRAVLIPMPTAAHRIRLRGVDGAAYLAQIAAQRLGLEVRHALHSTSRRAQRGRNRLQRLQAAAGRFSVQFPEKLQATNVVLIDDVVTTGATLREAAFVLRDAGATVCGALALARTL